MIILVEEKRLFGGKMTDERLEKAHVVTGDVISSMHKYFIFKKSSFYDRKILNICRPKISVKSGQKRRLKKRRLFGYIKDQIEKS